LGRQGNRAKVDVHPKADDLEAFTMFLFLVFERARDPFPKQEKLNLSLRAPHPTIYN
jgi:hypothetical protein